MEERNVKISLDKAKEWYKKGGELKEVALQAFTEKELDNKLPISWEDFCDMYPNKGNEWLINSDDSGFSQIPSNFKTKRLYKYDRNLLLTKEAADAHLAYIQLHRLRDCYRQGWKPDWSNSKQWCIMFDTDTFIVQPRIYYNRFLSFQSKEIAEKFFENFKNLIETAGDLI